MLLPLVLSYALMALSQSRGASIIEWLHGAEARVAAESLPPVLPDDVDLCAEYEAAHFDAASDVLHAAGMLCPLLLLPLGISRPRRFRALLWIPPCYYIPAWVGHFFLQKDIPAVFSYATTFQGWARGELCAYKALAQGRALRQPARDGIVAIVMAVFMVLVVRKNVGAASATKMNRKSG